MMSHWWSLFAHDNCRSVKKNYSLAHFAAARPERSVSFTHAVLCGDGCEQHVPEQFADRE